MNLRDQWIVRHRPDLQIIDQETWDKAAERLQELQDVCGKRPEQKKRGPRMHHTTLYPTGLLPGLIFCTRCGSRLWYRSNGERRYLGCPKSGHAEGACPMTTMAPIRQAEEHLLALLGQLLAEWPAWMRKVEEVSQVIPEQLEEDQRQLDKLETTITNLVDQLADGTFDSPAVRGRLREAEEEMESRRTRVEAASKLLTNPIELPSHEWIADQLRDSPAVFREDTPQSAQLLRRMLGNVWADHVLPPGKRRGYSRLRFQIDGLAALLTALGTKLSASTLALINRNAHGQGCSGELVLDLGGPSRMDEWAPKIAEMRSGGVPWKEIWRITGLGSGPAYVAWKRYVDAQAKLESEPQENAGEGSPGEDTSTDAA